MRLRFKIVYKLLTLLGAILLILIILLNTLAKQPASDEFITLIKEESIEIIPSSLKLTNKLINLTSFEYLIENHLCSQYKKELQGKFFRKSFKNY